MLYVSVTYDSHCHLLWRPVQTARIGDTIFVLASSSNGAVTAVQAQLPGHAGATGADLQVRPTTSCLPYVVCITCKLAAAGQQQIQCSPPHSPAHAVLNVHHAFQLKQQCAVCFASDVTDCCNHTCLQLLEPAMEGGFAKPLLQLPGGAASSVSINDSSQVGRRRHVTAYMQVRCSS